MLVNRFMLVHSEVQNKRKLNLGFKVRCVQGRHVLSQPASTRGVANVFLDRFRSEEQHTLTLGQALMGVFVFASYVPRSPSARGNSPLA